MRNYMKYLRFVSSWKRIILGKSTSFKPFDKFFFQYFYGAIRVGRWKNYNLLTFIILFEERYSYAIHLYDIICLHKTVDFNKMCGYNI
jgi:hypothetical protein